MFKKKISTTLLFLFFFGLITLHAQDVHPAREVGLQFNSFSFNGNSTFSAFFKKQKKENVYRRIRFFAGAITVNDRVDGTNDPNFSFNAGIAIGRERRKALDTKLVFFHGPEFSGSLGVLSNNQLTNVVVSTKFGWVFGLQHSFNDHWAVNLETIPSIGITVNAPEQSDPEYIVSAVGSNTVSLGLVRKF